jgi:hypothetical protein
LINTVAKMTAGEMSNAVEDKLRSDSLLWLWYRQSYRHRSVTRRNVVRVMVVVMAIDVMMVWDTNFALDRGR